jgi:hypothetical protein
MYGIACMAMACSSKIHEMTPRYPKWLGSQVMNTVSSGSLSPCDDYTGKSWFPCLFGSSIGIGLHIKLLLPNTAGSLESPVYLSQTIFVSQGYLAPASLFEKQFW